MSKSRVIFCVVISAIFWCMVQFRLAGDEYKAEEITQYVERVLTHEAEFALKSPANKNLKGKGARKGKYRCMKGHWRMIHGKSVFICD